VRQVSLPRHTDASDSRRGGRRPGDGAVILVAGSVRPPATLVTAHDGDERVKGTMAVVLGIVVVLLGLVGVALGALQLRGGLPGAGRTGARGRASAFVNIGLGLGLIVLGLLRLTGRL